MRDGTRSVVLASLQQAGDILPAAALSSRSKTFGSFAAPLFQRAWQAIKPTLTLVMMCAVLMASACARTIGDDCTTNVQCSALGDRFCDLSSPGGYCTVEGCDSTSCPDSSACVRFFSLKKGNATCDAGRIVRTDCSGGDCCKPGDPGCCKLGERCLCNEAGCQKGYCASENTERRFCMHPCESNDDCRAGYQCTSTGIGGAEALTTRDSSGALTQNQLSYCAPPS